MASVYSEHRARFKKALNPVQGVKRLARCNWGMGLHRSNLEESIDDELAGMNDPYDGCEQAAIQ